VSNSPRLLLHPQAYPFCQTPKSVDIRRTIHHPWQEASHTDKELAGVRPGRAAEALDGESAVGAEERAAVDHVGRLLAVLRHDAAPRNLRPKIAAPGIAEGSLRQESPTRGTKSPREKIAAGIIEGENRDQETQNRRWPTRGRRARRRWAERAWRRGEPAAPLRPDAASRTRI
jgi:hypothetical protein